MQILLIATLFLLDILQIFIFVDIILSWISLFFGKRLKINFISSIIDPIYKAIKKYIPTSFGAFDFSPIIFIFMIIFMKGLILAYDPSLQYYYKMLNF